MNFSALCPKWFVKEMSPKVCDNVKDSKTKAAIARMAALFHIVITLTTSPKKLLK
ncbi:hypothetical protein [Peribacillus muralis]|uniref:hypothetical protein n=1 Tax=Peribacillus muralis TaxID=264697 RepID=UPI003672DBB4